MFRLEQGSQAVARIEDRTTSQQTISDAKYIVPSPSVFEILGPRRIRVTTLTFQGHVTSSVMKSFDSP